MNKLTIIYRACNKEINSAFNVSRPYWFDKRKCFKSFWNSFGNKEGVDITIVFDGKEEDELAQYISMSKIKNIFYLNNVGNERSLLYCYRFASKIDFDYVFFVEDDYLYLPNSYDILVEGLNFIGEQNQFITLYDHYNRYLPPHITGDVTTGHDYCIITKSSHWRSGDSTTGSVAMTHKLFYKIKDRLLFHGVHDCAFYREMLKNGFRVFNCIPAKSTHVNKAYNSPLINWEKYNSEIII